MIAIAVAHLKGGVGKSTTTLFLAEHWALHGLRVLVVDLDPQSNSSFMLLSRQGLSNWEEAHRTLPDLFRDTRMRRQINYSAYIVPRASDLQELQTVGSRGFVSMLPSIPRLWFEEYDFDRDCHRSGLDPIAKRTDTIRALLDDCRDKFDCVLLDCPPGFGSLARSGIGAADSILTPTIADYVSTRSLADFCTYGLQEALRIVPREKMHVVISKYQSTVFQRQVLDLLNANYRVINPPIRLLASAHHATEHIHGRVRNYGQKYPDTLSCDVNALADEARRRLLGP